MKTQLAFYTTHIGWRKSSLYVSKYACRYEIQVARVANLKLRLKSLVPVNENQHDVVLVFVHVSAVFANTKPSFLKCSALSGPHFFLCLCVSAVALITLSAISCWCCWSEFAAQHFRENISFSLYTVFLDECHSQIQLILLLYFLHFKTCNRCVAFFLLMCCDFCISDFTLEHSIRGNDLQKASITLEWKSKNMNGRIPTWFGGLHINT